MEIHDNLHLLRKDIKSVFLEQRIADGFDGVEVELGSEVVEDVGTSGGIVTSLCKRRDRGPVSGCADEDLLDVLRVKISVCTETQLKCTGERVDEKIKKLVFVDSIVCLLVLLGHTSADRPLD